MFIYWWDCLGVMKRAVLDLMVFIALSASKALTIF